MGDFLNSLGKSMADQAMRRILYGFEIGIDEHDKIDTLSLLRMRELAHINPTVSPCALIICVNSRLQKYKSVTTISILTNIIRALTNSGLIRHERIRQIHFERKPSHKNNIETYVIASDD